MAPWIWIFTAFVVFGARARGVQAQCESSGRFANELAAGCRGYSTCIVQQGAGAGAGAASYRYDLVCPNGFLYNHLAGQCSNATGYSCLPAARCDRPDRPDRGYGSFPDPEAADCRSYVACFRGLEGVAARLVACAPGSLFDPAQQFCVNEDQYSCPAAATAPPPPPPHATATAPPATPTPEVTTVKPSSSPSIETASLFSHVVLLVFTILFGSRKV